MKTEAYICDCGCQQLFSVELMVGVRPIEDMFDKISSYPTQFTHIERLEVHYSLPCYKSKVLIPASNIVDRRKDERGYKLKVKELGYGLRAQCVANYLRRKRNLP